MALVVLNPQYSVVGFDDNSKSPGFVARSPRPRHERHNVSRKCHPMVFNLYIFDILRALSRVSIQY